MLEKRTLFSKISIPQILLIGLAVRLLAVFFSPGYAFHDDHFEMPELVFRWRNGVNFLWTGSNVHVFSLVYPGFMYLLFDVCGAAGIRRPEDLMFVVRLIHALVSLLGIYYAYRLTFRLTNRKDISNLVALLMALFWIFPFMSVRNLREFFCIPFLLIGSYHIADQKLTYRSILLASFFFAVSFSIRLQTIFIPAGVGLSFLFNKQYRKKALVLIVGFGVAYMLTQGLFDIIYYGDPFANIKEYVRFNLSQRNIEIQPHGPWYQYLETVAGVVFGPPFLLLFWGYLFCIKLPFRTKMFFVGSLLFFVFHSYYSNKQERFLLPFIPYFLLLAVIGLHEYYSKNKISRWIKKSARIIIIWFLIFNTMGLLVLSFTYSKRSRVESMIYLRKKGDVTNIIMEGDVSLQRPPLFYLGKHLNIYTLPEKGGLDKLQSEISSGINPAPNYAILAGNNNLDKRLARLKTIFPDIHSEVIIKTGFVDNLAYWLNPKHNQNENWYIYRLK